MHKKNHKPVIVGISGGSASGKGVITSALEKSLSKFRINIFHMDAYFKKPLPECIAPFSDRKYDDYNHPDSFYTDKLIDDIEHAVQSNIFDVIVIEGLLVLQNNDLRKLLDLKIFVDADADERIVRRLKRNMAERGLSFDKIADYYLDSVRFRHKEFVEPSKWYADIIMNGSQYSNTAIEILANWIRSKI